MASDPEPPAETAQRRPMSRRKKRKLIVAVFVIAVAMVVVFWGWSTTGGDFVSVSDIVHNPLQYSGKVVEVRGIVSGWDGSPSDLNFTLSDTDSGLGGSLAVTMLGALPAGFENGKTVSARGQLDDADSLHFSASAMTVGCASKY